MYLWRIATIRDGANDGDFERRQTKAATGGDIKKKRTLNEANEATGAATNLAQSIADTASSTRKSRASSAGDLGETLLGPVGGGALVAAASEAHGRGAEHGASERRDHLGLSGAGGGSSSGGCSKRWDLTRKKIDGDAGFESDWLREGANWGELPTTERWWVVVVV